MRWTFRRQILVPFAVLLVGVIALTSAIAATLAVQRLKAERAEHSREVAEVLTMSQFPVTPDILGKLKILTGCELVVAEGSTIRGGTIPEGSLRIEDLADQREIDLNGERYGVIPSEAKGGLGRRMFILAPQSRAGVPWREVIWPVIGVAVLTGGAATGVAAWLAARYARQIRGVQEQLRAIADHQYQESDPEGSVVELNELQHSANELARRLSGFEKQIAETERLRLLGQLSGGLAHTLRNSLAGARLAIQYHQKKCHKPTNEGSNEHSGLEAAQLQLRLVEDQVQGLLTLGTPQTTAPTAGELREILQEVERLITPVCAHHRVSCTILGPEGELPIGIRDSQGMRIAILNLCLNAIEAAGPGGKISISAGREGEVMQIVVVDNGKGIPEGVSERLGEPFVTGKQEGIGLGLMIARDAVQKEGGGLDWRREGGETILRLSWPLKRETGVAALRAKLQETSR